MSESKKVYCKHCSCKGTGQADGSKSREELQAELQSLERLKEETEIKIQGVRWQLTNLGGG